MSRPLRGGGRPSRVGALSLGALTPRNNVGMTGQHPVALYRRRINVQPGTVRSRRASLGGPPAACLQRFLPWWQGTQPRVGQSRWELFSHGGEYRGTRAVCRASIRSVPSPHGGRGQKPVPHNTSHGAFVWRLSKALI